VNDPVPTLRIRAVPARRPAVPVPGWHPGPPRPAWPGTGDQPVLRRPGRGVPAMVG